MKALDKVITPAYGGGEPKTVREILDNGYKDRRYLGINEWRKYYEIMINGLDDLGPGDEVVVWTCKGRIGHYRYEIAKVEKVTAEQIVVNGVRYTKRYGRPIGTKGRGPGNPYQITNVTDHMMERIAEQEKTT